ncbi:MAG: long-chain-fatty-acid--CoA ligase [Candidatus Tectomicrobia bacterium]|nr:long-chain-fatty-acid--CoA ligase [Candidatus Tectomicrobia bacterium]
MDAGTLVSRAARWHAGKTAVVCAGKARTFAEIGGNANRAANALAGLGLAKGDRVALYADNSVEYFETLFGLFKGGLVSVGVNSMLSAGESVHIINHSGARAVVTSPRLAGELSSRMSEMPGVENWICIGEPPEGMREYGEFIRGARPSPPGVQVDEGDLAQLFYTGGTTGAPKGVMVTHDIVVNALRNIQAEFVPIRQSDVVLSPGSLAHASGYYSMVTFIKGGKLLIPEGFNPPEVLSAIEREEVTVIPGYPVTLIRLVDYPGLGEYDLGSLRLLTYGASPMPTEKLRKALGIFGMKLAQGYGQAEAMMTITCLTPEDHAHALAENSERLASCGRPYMTQEVRVVDEQDRELPRGEKGEVITRGKVCTAGYWNNPRATADAVRDGWVHTGDVGWMDEEGYLYLVDRKKDVIISGGENIYAREVEDVLNGHPAVAEAAVVGVPDEEWGEAVKAVVALKPGMRATGEEIIQFCKERLSSYKKPKSVDFLAELPRTAAGKISKKDLRDPHWAGRARKI